MTATLPSPVGLRVERAVVTGPVARVVAVQFEDFVREQTPGLLRSAYLLTRSMPVAEDLVQDTLLRLYGKWDKVQAADVPLAYVRRALVNGFLNDKRRPSRRESVIETVPESGPDGMLVFGSTADPHYGFSDQLADRDQLWQLMGTLPDRQRAALVLRFFHDLSDEQIAQHLDARVGTVRSLVSRGLAALRSELESVEGGAR